MTLRDLGVPNPTILRQRYRSRTLYAAATAPPHDPARDSGFKMFPSASDMFRELRRGVMLKMIRQAHEAELAEPGEPPTSSIVGVPEW